MIACHRCGYPDLADPVEIDGHHYGPTCARYVGQGWDPAAPMCMTATVRWRQWVCGECCELIAGATTLRDHTAEIRLHRCPRGKARAAHMHTW